jgi:TRAP-type transport system periplasmic protein
MEAGIDGHSVDIATPPDEVMAVIQAQGDALTDSWLAAVDARGFDGAGVLEHFNEAQARYAEELAANGYPWD